MMITNEMTMTDGMQAAAHDDGERAGVAARMTAAVAWLDSKGEQLMHPMVLSVCALVALAVLLGGPCKPLALTVVPLLVMVVFSLAARAEMSAS